MKREPKLDSNHQDAEAQSADMVTPDEGQLLKDYALTEIVFQLQGSAVAVRTLVSLREWLPKEKTLEE